MKMKIRIILQDFKSDNNENIIFIFLPNEIKEMIEENKDIDKLIDIIGEYLSINKYQKLWKEYMISIFNNEKKSIKKIIESIYTNDPNMSHRKKSTINSCISTKVKKITNLKFNTLCKNIVMYYNFYWSAKNSEHKKKKSK